MPSACTHAQAEPLRADRASNPYPRHCTRTRACRSLPALVNVGSLLFLCMFMYAVMGMSLFGQIKYQENITRHANFRTFASAMLVLFRQVPQA